MFPLDTFILAQGHVETPFDVKSTTKSRTERKHRHVHHVVLGFVVLQRRQFFEKNIPLEAVPIDHIKRKRGIQIHRKEKENQRKKKKAKQFF